MGYSQGRALSMVFWPFLEQLDNNNINDSLDNACNVDRDRKIVGIDKQGVWDGKLWGRPTWLPISKNINRKLNKTTISHTSNLV
jgi:hypothetical protein